MLRSKRLIIVVLSGIFLAGLAVLSVYKAMEALASTCVAGILTILSTYIYSETKRQSKKNE